MERKTYRCTPLFLGFVLEIGGIEGLANGKAIG